ncbi:phospholipase D2-like isoform X2 [Dinothrombium tinctorium]|uniref:Phospholipase n=1 Tax=Dinothrombium tinctorium TaxID=1965070 RepID=A0A443RL51_9ACAR|nr:phospholipase D2-like isoform X2 [Dinothrombium tinctorium]
MAVNNNAAFELDEHSSDNASDFDNLFPPDYSEIEDEEGVYPEPTFLARIPYTSVYEPPVSITESKPFLPGCPLHIRIIDVIHTPEHHYLNPYLYVIEIRHADFLWIVKRRYSHFLTLHQQLRLYRTSLDVPLPLKRHQERRRSITKSNRHPLPRFPRKPDALIAVEDIKKRAEQLEKYLQHTLSIDMYRNHHSVFSFLEICHLSFVDELGHKGKEGLVRKRAGGHRRGNICNRLKNSILSLIGHWKKRWLIAKDSCLIYVRPKDGKIKAVLLMDEEFKVSTYSDTYIRISNLSRDLVLQCWTSRKAQEWTEYLNEIAQTLGKDFTESHRFSSFAPIRKQTPVHWFVDGQSYCEAVSEALEKAEQEVFIADWWFTPEIYMKRPVIHGDMWRLDKILQRIASRGVKVFVLLYKEVELALGINSLYSKRQLMKLHPNIRVLRHPNSVGGVLLWSHHEKIVVIDQSYAFVGGIDLCYGRWDNYDHRLTDLGGIKHTKSEATNVDSVGAATLDASSENALTLDFDESSPNYQTQRASTDSKKDLFKRAALKVIDKTKTSHEHKENDATNRPKNPPKLLQVVNRLNAFRLVPKRRDSFDESDRMEKEKEEHWRQSFIDAGFEGGAKLWFGKDYANFILKDFVQLNQLYQDLVDRHTTPRMPWHDIAVMVQGAAARDVARHFIQRWNQTKHEKAKYYDKYNWLLPKSYKTLERIRNFKFLSKGYNVDCQVVRSISSWSAGTKVTECSIHNAYLDVIHNAKHYIYIENQFFVTQSSGKMAAKDSPVMNEIGEALFRRIVRAFRNDETFRVYVLIPLLPAFEGELGTSSGTALQAVTHWNMNSISRGSDSLLQRLQREVGDPMKYISFYGLRNYDELNGKLVTELIYVHSKLIIADDKITIIGSSNINDRSMVGYRDSEIALVIQDIETTEGLMNGQPYRSGRFSGSLRRFLFREHLGVLDSDSSKVDVRDPVCDKFYKDTWIATAAKNSSIYEKVFGVVPSDDVHTFAQLRERQKKQWLSTSNFDEAQKLSKSVQGHIVLLPLLFLKDEDLQPAPGTKEALMPSSLWT